MPRTTLYVVILLGLASAASAQWPARTVPDVPRSTDGTVNLTAPTPRTSHGRPDLSGLWIPQPDPNGKPEGVENTVFPRYLINVTKDLEDQSGLLVPAAESRYRKRLATEGVEDPIAHCQPPGSSRIFSLPRPTKIIETPGVMLLLHEHDTTYRQIFTDGRPLPEEPFPTWMGYSIGRWDHDTFVVTTIGLTDRIWLDVQGHPQTEALDDRTLPPNRCRSHGHRSDLRRSRYLQNAADDYTQAATAPRSGDDRVFLLRQRKGPTPLRHANPAISAVTVDYKGCSIVMPCMTPVGPM